MALSRLDPRKYGKMISSAFREAGTSAEKIFSALAILQSSDRSHGDAAITSLKVDLQDRSWFIGRPGREDIVSVLCDHSSAEARLLGKCWEAVYSRQNSPLLEKHNEIRATTVATSLWESGPSRSISISRCFFSLMPDSSNDPETGFEEISADRSLVEADLWTAKCVIPRW